MADGSVVIDTKLDKSGFKKGLAELGGIAAAGVAAVVAGMSAAGASMIKTGMEYEKTMSGISAISGATAEQMASMDAVVMKAGKDTVFSSAEAAMGLQELIKAGLTTEQATLSLTDALNLASAGEVSVSEAAEVASTVLNAFRKDQLSVADASNLLAGGANASSTDISGLKLGLSQCSAVAAGMGMTFEDTATGLSVFAQYGLKGSDAGTSLKTMLMNLQPVTDKQCALFKRLNLLTDEGQSKFYDAAGSMKPLNEIAGLLNTSMGDLTDAERAMALEMMFGTDAVRAGNIMFQAGAKGVDEMNTAMKGVTAADVAAEKLNNLSGDVEFLTGSIETLGIGVYKTMQGPLRGAVQFLTGEVDGLLTAFDAGGIEGLVSAAGTVLGDIVNKVVEFAPKMITAAMSLIESIIKGLSENMPSIAKSAMDIVNTVLISILGMLPMIVDAGMKLLIGLVQGISGMIPTLIPAIVGAAVGMVKALIDNVPMFVDAAIQLVQGLVQGLLRAIPKLINTIPQLIQRLCGAITVAVPQLIEAAISLVNGIISALPTIINSIVMAIPAIIQAIVTMVTTLLPQIIQAGVDLFMALVTALPVIIDQIVLAIPSIINSLLSMVVDMLPVIIDAGVQLFMALVNALPEIISGIVGVIPVILASLISVLLGSLQQIIEAGLKLFLALVDALPTIIIGIVAVLPQIISSVITALLDSIPLLIQCGIDLLMSLIGAMPEIIASIVAVLPTLIKSVITALLKAIPQIIDCGIDLFKALIKAMPTIIKALVAAMPQIVTAITDALRSLMYKMVDIGKNLLEGIWNGLSNAKDWLVSKVKELLGGVTDTIKAFFGISSPSKLFENVIGKNLMLGLVKGIEGQAKNVGNSMAEIGKIIASTDLDMPASDILNGVDTGDIYRKVVNTVDYETGRVSKLVSAKSATAKNIGADTGAEKDAGKGGKPKYIENHIIVDGKEAGRVLTPYIEKELEWRGK